MTTHQPPARTSATLRETDASATAGVSDPRLATLLADHWAWVMEQDPVWATTIGHHHLDARLGDNSMAGMDARKAARRDFLERAKAVAPAALTERDSVTWSLFVENLEADIGTEVCEYELWSLSVRGDRLLGWMILPDQHAVRTPADGQNLVARYGLIAGQLDAEIVKLREGLRRGLTPDAEVLRRTLVLVAKQVQQPLTGWPLAAPIKTERAGWTAQETAAFRAGIETVLRDRILPAAKRYQTFLESEVAPKARGPQEPGIGALPNGAACYAAQMRNHLGPGWTDVEQLHALGLTEIHRINGQMQALGQKIFGTRDLGKILARLRSDRALYFVDAKEIERRAKESLARAQAAVPKWFGTLPKTGCIVSIIPEYEAPFTTVAYYREPHADGTKPGEYFINIHEPTTRPRFEAEALAFHEAVPGHHLQIALAQEQGELPAFRRYLGTTAFVEGWALYAERLAEEMGLYSDDLALMGELSYEAWRASRLVVDTGLHSQGWTREQAMKFMLDHTALSPENIDNEVDRYISWPGQALAYKVGQLEILALRAFAQETLGTRFDIRGFHDAVLLGGAVTLPVLRQRVEAWVAAVDSTPRPLPE